MLLFRLFYQVEIRSPPSTQGTEGVLRIALLIFYRNCAYHNHAIMSMPLWANGQTLW